VRRAGDADRAAQSDELKDLVCSGVGLPGAWRSLQRQVRTAERRGRPGCGLGYGLAPARNDRWSPQPWWPAATNASYRDTPAVIIWHFKLGSC
jgi:hypothetical protein